MTDEQKTSEDQFGLPDARADLVGAMRLFLQSVDDDSFYDLEQESNAVRLIIGGARRLHDLLEHLPLAHRVKVLEAENKALLAQRQDLYDQIQRMKRPEPFYIGEVIGYKDEFRYPLQIEGIDYHYPLVHVRVRLP